MYLAPNQTRPAECEFAPSLNCHAKNSALRFAAMSLLEIQAAVQKLPEKERGQLAAWILETLPEHADEDAIVESIAEAERRETEMEQGITQPLTESEFWSSLKQERS
jgi:hypothetical protein